MRSNLLLCVALLLVIVQSTSQAQIIPLTGGKSISAPIYWSEDTKNALATVYSVTAIAESPFTRDVVDLAAIENTIPRFPEGSGGRLGIGYQNTAAGFRDHHGIFFTGAILKVSNGVEPSTRQELLDRREDFPKYRSGRTIWVNDTQEIKDMQPNGLHIFDIPRGLEPGVYRLTWKAFLAQRTDHRLLGLGVPDRKDQIAHGYVSFHVVRFKTSAATIKDPTDSVKPASSEQKDVFLLAQLMSLGWSPLYLDDPIVETRSTKTGDVTKDKKKYDGPVTLIYQMVIRDKRDTKRVVEEYEAQVRFRILDHAPTISDGGDTADVIVVDLKAGRGTKEVVFPKGTKRFWIRAWSTLRNKDGVWCPWSKIPLDTVVDVPEGDKETTVSNAFPWGVAPKEATK